MLEIIRHVPFFVWPVFAILILGGLKATKPSEVPLLPLLLFPFLFLIWSLYSFFNKSEDNLILFIPYLASLISGFMIGFAHLQKLNLSFDRKNKKVLMPGSWVPLVLSMSVFSTRFAIGMLGHQSTALKDSPTLLYLEIAAALFLGIFLGRALNCYLRYRNSSTKLKSDAS